MKRFLAFRGEQYYPSGGWGDFEGDYDTLKEALAAVGGSEWWHVVDMKKKKIVREGGWSE